MPQSSAGRVLRIQTVLYRNDLAQLWRLLRGLDAAARHAIDAGLVSRVEWALGDCSPAAVMAHSDVRAMTDATLQGIDHIEYEFFNENLGSSGGQNRLAVDRSCDLLFVLNPDTYPSPRALAELVRAMDKPQVGIAEAKQIPLEHPRHYDLSTGETGWASGCCMLVKRTLFDELDGFDSEHFLLHCDDVDFSWRVRLLGLKVVTVPYAAVFHDKRPTVGNAWPTPDIELYHGALGRLMLATRWGRPDVVDATIRSIEEGDSTPQSDALAEFRMRVSTGRIPGPVPGADAVAEFVGGEYARHRF